MERNKKIYFCVDVNSYIDRLNDLSTCFPYYNEAEKAIKKGKDCIVTTSMAHFSFALRNLGYKIYLCYKDKEVEIKPHMDLTGIGEPCKDLRFGHNIFRMFRAGIFNKLLGLD